MTMNTPIIRTKFKDLVAKDNYNKKWDDLSIVEQNDLRAKHRQQFYILSRKARKEMNDHDLLVEVNTILKELKNDFDNHLKDHKKYMYLALSTAIGAIITLAITLIKVL